MIKWLLFGLLIINCQSGMAQDSTKIYLWKGEAPMSLGHTASDSPYLLVYHPRKPNGISVLICPGGGYVYLAMDHEGRWVAGWLNTLGITAAVLRYRIDNNDQTGYHYPVQLLDVKRGMRLLRDQAAAWHLDTARIGVMGFSAGGHLASMLGTHYDAGNPYAADRIDRMNCRPDFMILIYPVITMRKPYVHEGSRIALLGRHPSEGLVDSLSGEMMVTPETPPTFLLCANDDQVVPPENSIDFYLALHHAGVAASLHILDHGGHGFGYMPGKKLTEQWTAILRYWLRDRGLLN